MYISIFFITTKTMKFCNIYVISDQVKIPRIGSEVAVIPTHVIGPNQLYVQLGAYSEQFNMFQTRTLQQVELKTITHTPGTNNYFDKKVSKFICKLLT